MIVSFAIGLRLTCAGAVRSGGKFEVHSIPALGRNRQAIPLLRVEHHQGSRSLGSRRQPRGNVAIGEIFLGPTGARIG